MDKITFVLSNILGLLKAYVSDHNATVRGGITCKPHYGLTGEKDLILIGFQFISTVITISLVRKVRKTVRCFIALYFMQ